ncbi:MAG: hypothetical protein RIQ81_1412 [Pseudomonadota bacterium]|jgi:monoamine oxidase
MFQFNARHVIALLSAALVSSTALAVPRTTDVVIVGAGLSGLTAAHELKGRGLSYHVLELAPIIGGRIKTVAYSRQEFRASADAGMEEYWDSNPAVSLIRKLKLPIRTDPAVSSIVIGGKLYSLGGKNPSHHLQDLFDADELAALVRFNQRVEALLQGITPGGGIPEDRKHLVHKSFADWVREQKPGHKVEEWIRITLECEIGTAWDRISALDGISEFHIFLGEGETSYRVAGGNVKFIDALASDVGRENISLNKRVIRIAHKDGRSRVTFLSTDTNRNEEIEARHVIVTVPLYRLMEIQFEPALSQVKRDAIASMTWGSYFKVHVLVPKSSERFWTASLPLLSDSDLGVIYDGNPDQAGDKNSLRVLSLLIGGDRAERLNFTPLDQARAEIKAAFDKLWPGFSAGIVDMEFYRYHPRAIASWPVGRSRFDQQSDEIRKPENRVYLAGDHTESSHSDGAVNSAVRAVAQIFKSEGLKAGETLTAKHKKTQRKISKLNKDKKQGRQNHEPVNQKL